jgi:hypothetical protein
MVFLRVPLVSQSSATTITSGSLPDCSADGKSCYLVDKNEMDTTHFCQNNDLASQTARTVTLFQGYCDEVQKIYKSRAKADCS